MPTGIPFKCNAYAMGYSEANKLRPVSPKDQSSIRLSDKQRRQLEKLQEKLGLDRSNVIRLAVAKLAEAEGIK